MHPTHAFYKENIFIYSFGKNKHGELGHGTLVDTGAPLPLKNLINISSPQISPGGKHTLLIKNHSKSLYSCGSGEFGVLGNSSNNKMKCHLLFEQIEVLEEEKIEKIACAEFHSWCLTSDGFVCSWGGNFHNKLGHDGLAGVPTIIRAIAHKKVKDIACGDYHSVVITNDNEVFTWGGGGKEYNHGQCGLGSLSDINTPTQIHFFNKKIPLKVSCGGYHTLVQCADNSIYSFGKGNYGQCGYGCDEDTHTPKQIILSHGDDTTTSNEDISDISDISCGGEHSVILTSKGRWFTFGHGYNGQLGHGINNNVLFPKQVASLKNVKVRSVSCGWLHTIIITDKGYVYCTGSNKYGELGLGADDRLSRQHFVLNKEVSKWNVVNIFCGGHHSFITVNPKAPIRCDYTVPEPWEYHEHGVNAEKDPDAIININININANIDPIVITGERVKKPRNPRQTYEKVMKSSIKYDWDKWLKSPINSTSHWNNRKIVTVVHTSLPMNTRYVKFSIKNNKMFNKVYKTAVEKINEFILDSDVEVVSHSLIESFHYWSHSTVVEKYRDLDGLYKELPVMPCVSTAPLGCKEYIWSVNYLSRPSNKEETRKEWNWISNGVKVYTINDLKNKEGGIITRSGFLIFCFDLRM